MGVFADGSKKPLIEKHSVVLCFALCRHKCYHFWHLSIRLLITVPQLSSMPPHHHQHCQPQSIIYQLFLHERETDNYSLCPPVLQWINMTWRSDSFACHFPICVFWNMKPCDTLCLRFRNPASAYTHGHQKRTNGVSFVLQLLKPA